MTPRDVVADGTLTIHPGYQFGEVCVGLTRVPAHAVASCVFAGDNLDDIADGYDLTRLQVLTACWWYVEQAQGQRRRSRAEQRLVDAWGDWGSAATGILGGWQKGPCPDPPEAAS